METIENRDAFRQWLEEFPDLAVVGHARRAYDCPLARWLGGGAEVGRTDCRHRGHPRRLPPWAVEFVRLIDTAVPGTPITAAAARDILLRAAQNTEAATGG